MNLLKENMFLVVTAAIVLVGGAALLLVINSGDSQADAGGKTYASVSKEISSLASSGVNQAVVEAAERRVEGMRNEAKKVADESLLHNRRDYKVLSFKISGKTVPAFPVDPEFKDRETLRLLFPEKYRLRVEALRKTLKPTVPPTAKEVGNEVARIAASVMPAEEEKKDQPKPTTPRAVKRRDVKMFEPGGMFEHERGERGERYRPPVGMERARPSAARPTGVGQSAVEQQALINLVISKSEQGWIYADKEEVQAGMGDRRSAAGAVSGIA